MRHEHFVAQEAERLKKMQMLSSINEHMRNIEETLFSIEDQLDDVIFEDLR